MSSPDVPAEANSLTGLKRKIEIETEPEPEPELEIKQSAKPGLQDLPVDEAKERKIAALRARNEALRADIAATKQQVRTVVEGLKSPPEQTVKAHINLLHTYNEIRDIGQGLMGMVADNRGVRVRDVYEEFEVKGAE